MDMYLRPPQPKFSLWKWIVFAPLFLLILDYVSSQVEDTNVMGIAMGLGFVLAARIFAVKRSLWGLLSGLCLSVLISSIASAYLYAFCWVQPLGGLCESRNLQAYILSNYVFSNGSVIIWIAIETFLVIGKNIAYIFRYIKR